MMLGQRLAHLRPVRGMRDCWNGELRRRRHIENTMEMVVKLCGYRPMETPIVEFTDVFRDTLGSDSDVVNKEMYTFPSRSGQSLSLRPENTASIVRAVLSRNLLHQERKPLKLYYCGPMFRYERPQKGRYRQFNQFGVEILGAEQASADADAIACAYLCLKKLALTPSLELRMNSLGDEASRRQYEEALNRFLLPKKDHLSADSQQRLEDGKVLRILDSKSETDQEVLREAPPLWDYLTNKSKTLFNSVYTQVAKSLNIPVRIDPQLVRGLDYYCETVFEFSEKPEQAALGKANTVLAGGRYNVLPAGKGFSLPVSGIGWAAGTDRLGLLDAESALSSSDYKVLVAGVGTQRHDVEDSMKIEDAVFSITQSLRNSFLSLPEAWRNASYEILSTENTDSVQKQLKTANRLQADFIVFIGTDEINENVATIKDLKTGQQLQVSSDCIFDKIFKITAEVS